MTRPTVRVAYIYVDYSSSDADDEAAGTGMEQLRINVDHSSAYDDDDEEAGDMYGAGAAAYICRPLFC